MYEYEFLNFRLITAQSLSLRDLKHDPPVEDHYSNMSLFNDASTTNIKNI
jgi:hypothetical protein